MSVSSLASPASPAAAARPAPARPDHQYWALAAFMAALAAVSIGALAVDPRELNGANVWAKPIKFQASLALHCATLALISAQLSPAWRNARLLWFAAGASVVCGAGELGYIMLQAAQGEASHFNVTSAFHSAMYSLMGVGAVLLILAAVAVAWAVWRDPTARLGPATRLGATLGLTLGFALTLVVGLTLGGNGGHHVGAPVSDAAGLPLFGWSQSGGDLRPAHFFALHTMQALPLLGLLLDRFLRTRGGGRRWALALVWAGAALAAALTLGTFFQALAGRPFLAL